jgi:mono/diheme cytochrome c family protein
MMTMEKAQRIIEVVVVGNQRNCRMRRTSIAGLLLAGCATAALAAGQTIFKAQCCICHAVLGFLQNSAPSTMVTMDTLSSPMGSKCAGYSQTSTRLLG